MSFSLGPYEKFLPSPLGTYCDWQYSSLERSAFASLDGGLLDDSKSPEFLWEWPQVRIKSREITFTTTGGPGNLKKKH